jgi:hypothetical protein
VARLRDQTNLTALMAGRSKPKGFEPVSQDPNRQKAQFNLLHVGSEITATGG